MKLNLVYLCRFRSAIEKLYDATDATTSRHYNATSEISDFFDMKPTQVLGLIRPWQKERGTEIFYGMTKTGNKRWSLTTKQGNKNFYKGTGSTGIGNHTNKGQYRINWEKVRTYVVPRNLETTELRPFVCPTAPNLKNHYDGYKRGAVDGKLHLRKAYEFVKYGTEESPEMVRKNGYSERG